MPYASYKQTKKKKQVTNFSSYHCDIETETTSPSLKHSSEVGIGVTDAYGCHPLLGGNGKEKTSKVKVQVEPLNLVPFICTIFFSP